nr:MAG TPA: hypothetical protein [Caudoviricetes sp.]
MANGVFGSVRPANIDPSVDVDMYYYYRPSRGETDENFKGFKKLNSGDCLTKSVDDTETENTIIGMYNLKLPLETFNKKGFYTIYIKPKECTTKIVDVSVLAAYPDVKGVVLNIQSGTLAGLSDLTGYRMEFSDGTTRLIKSCNRCEPVIVNTGDGYPKSTRYNLIDSSSNYVFCTVSPSSSPTFKVNASPYIGESGAEVKIINTKFNPVAIEVEMTTHDADTISYMLEGDQSNDGDNAIITTYNDKHEIYHQFDYYVIKDRLGNPINKIKKQRTNIDESQSYDNVME